MSALLAEKLTGCLFVSSSVANQGHFYVDSMQDRHGQIDAVRLLEEIIDAVETVAHGLRSGARPQLRTFLAVHRAGMARETASLRCTQRRQP